MFRGTVEIQGSEIQSVDSTISGASGAIDLEGDFVLPGLIDLHTDAMQGHHVPRPGVRWPIPAAVAAHDAQMATSRVTTVFDSLSIGVGGEEEDALRDRLRSAIAELEQQHERHLRSEHFLHLRLEIAHSDTAEAFLEFADLSILKLVSLTDHTPGQGQYPDIERWRKNFRNYVKSPEDVEKILQHRLECHEKYSGPNRIRIGAEARERGLPLASHDDRTLEDVANGHAAGVTISEFPVTLDAAIAAKEKGLAVIMGGPNLVLGGSHSGNVAASDVARGGWLDGLTSDYVPSSMLQGAFLLHEEQDVPLPEAIGSVTSAPAKMVGLTDRGEIAIGKRADLVRVRMVAGMPRAIAVWREGVRVA